MYNFLPVCVYIYIYIYVQFSSSVCIYIYIYIYCNGTRLLLLQFNSFAVSNIGHARSIQTSNRESTLSGKLAH